MTGVRYAGSARSSLSVSLPIKELLDPLLSSWGESFILET
jgi:hypothetical protein